MNFGYGRVRNDRLASVQTEFGGHRGYRGQPTQICTNLVVSYEGQAGAGYGTSS
jgi:hypothetical protein